MLLKPTDSKRDCDLRAVSFLFKGNSCWVAKIVSVQPLPVLSRDWLNFSTKGTLKRPKHRRFTPLRVPKRKQNERFLLQPATCNLQQFVLPPEFPKSQIDFFPLLFRTSYSKTFANSSSNSAAFTAPNQVFNGVPSPSIKTNMG